MEADEDEIVAMKDPLNGTGQHVAEHRGGMRRAPVAEEHDTDDELHEQVDQLSRSLRCFVASSSSSTISATSPNHTSYNGNAEDVSGEDNNSNAAGAAATAAGEGGDPHTHNTYASLSSVLSNEHLFGRGDRDLVQRKISPNSGSEPLEVLRALNMVVGALHDSGNAFADARQWRNKYERMAERLAEVEHELRVYKKAIHANSGPNAIDDGTFHRATEEKIDGAESGLLEREGQQRDYADSKGISGLEHIRQKMNLENITTNSTATAKDIANDDSVFMRSKIVDHLSRKAIMAAVADKDGRGEVRFEGVSVGEAAAAFVAANEAHAWASHVENERNRSHEDYPYNCRSHTSFTLYRDFDFAHQPSVSSAMGTHTTTNGLSKGLEQKFPNGFTGRGDRRQSIPEFSALSSSSLRLRWLSRPKVVLIIVKPEVAAVRGMLRQALRLLTSRDKMTVYLEPREHERLKQEMTDLPLVSPDASPVSTPDSSPKKGDLEKGTIRTWVTDVNSIRPTVDVLKRLDLIITFGGDGTVLWSSTLLGKGPIPPVLSFSMGSLGFLAPFSADRWDANLEDVLDGDFPLMLRHRLHCRIERSGVIANDDDPDSEGTSDEEDAGDLRGTPPMEDIIVMNEVVIDRGMSPFLTNIECYCDGVYVTAVQGDGIIISTPTGSTAYSVAAGGSMVHPQVPGMLFTPICPHSLSFRPLVFPDTVTLQIQMQRGSRNATCWCSFDGKERMQLSEGDRLVIALARAPVPIICNKNATEDWFGGLSSGLLWNHRNQQQAFQ